MKLAVVIVNYRTADLALECLASLEPELASIPESCALIVDNASADGSAERIEAAIRERGWGSWLEFLRAPRNGGFAYGNNVALEALDSRGAEPEYVHLLNPDTVVLPGALRTLLTFLEEHREVGIAGSQLETAAGGIHPNGFRFFSIASEFEAMVSLRIFSRMLAPWTIAKPLSGGCEPVDWVCGASMLIRAGVFEDVPRLDENYFLYYEEVDFCLQARRAGWECWYVPESRVVHVVSAASDVLGGNRHWPAYWFESRRYYFLKNHGYLYAFFANLAWLLGLAVHGLRCALQRKSAGVPARALRDFMRLSFKTTMPGVVENASMTDTPVGNPTPSRRLSPMLVGDCNNNPPGLSLAALIAEDFRTHDRELLNPGFWAVALHRFGNWRMGVRPRLLRGVFTAVYRTLYTFLRLGVGIELPYVILLGRRLRIWHHGGIFIGARSIGDDVHIRHNTTMGVLHRGEGDYKPVIGNRVDIGPGVAILGGVEVGDDVVIGANSVVVKNVPAHTTVFGVPARRVNLIATRPAPEPRSEDALRSS